MGPEQKRHDVRQFVWRVAEPTGLLKRNEQEEDHATRRTARAWGRKLAPAISAAVAKALA